MMTPNASARPRRRILVASPIEPSGASWLLNCFLELGIRVDHKPVVDRVWRGAAAASDAGRMWIGTSGQSVTLHPKAGVLIKFLPALARQTEFCFRDDVAVEYVQDLPMRDTQEASRVLMVRDPRDAIYSSYLRSAPAMSFAEYMHFLHPGTLLDRPTHWALFAAAWLVQPGIHIARFEDYKRDAQGTLRAVLAALDLPCADGDITNAVRFSSFEAAREVEQKVRGRFPNDPQVANRSGKIGEGRSHPDVQPLLADIEVTTATELRSLGYDAPQPAARDRFAAARLSAAFLACLKAAQLPDGIADTGFDAAASERALMALLAFAHRLDDGLIGRANLPPADARMLLDSLAEFTRAYAGWLAGRLGTTRAKHADGSAHFFRRIRQMRHAGGHGAAGSST